MSEVTTLSPIRDPPPVLAILGARWGRLERRLFQDLVAQGRPVAEVKRTYLARYRISARQFNSLRIGLEGKVRAWREGTKAQEADLRETVRSLERRIARQKALHARLTRQIALLGPSHRPAALGPLQEHRQRIAFQLFGRKRRLAHLKRRLEALRRRHRGTPAICFGGRRLFRAQFQLEANGFKDHQAWLGDWRRARSGQFLQVGSKDEKAGNGECHWDTRRASLSLRLPDALVRQGRKRLELPVCFYRDQDLLASLEAGRAISYRFVRRPGDGERWDVHATTLRVPADLATRRHLGIVGADLNVDHVAVAELDRSGNLVGRRRIPLAIHGLGSDQARGRIGDAVAELAGLARAAGKPLAIEALDFRRKKAALRELGKPHARRLSGFAFAAFQAALASRCEREGVELRPVDPRLTSVIGAAKFMAYGISTHEAAAMAIARRAMGWGEGLRARTASPRLGRALCSKLEEIAAGRKAGEHVWIAWQRLGPWLKDWLRKGRALRSVQDGGRLDRSASPGEGHPHGRGDPPGQDDPSGQAPRCLDTSRSRRSGGALGTPSQGEEEPLR